MGQVGCFSVLKSLFFSQTFAREVVQFFLSYGISFNMTPYKRVNKMWIRHTLSNYIKKPIVQKTYSPMSMESLSLAVCKIARGSRAKLPANLWHVKLHVNLMLSLPRISM